uniref:Uncharacterized protein n=1 Tax=Arundo donax TaxID=35708 RepID=A0A0A9BMA2_ARUDO
MGTICAQLYNHAFKPSYEFMTFHLSDFNCWILSYTQIVHKWLNL